MKLIVDGTDGDSRTYHGLDASSIAEGASCVAERKKMTEAGLPYFAAGSIVKGFGRGSKELGIPTANFPFSVVRTLPEELETGVYCGWASVDNGEVHKMVMSIGWNPFYQNTEKSMEVHILYDYQQDLYGLEMRVVVLGFLRSEKTFGSVGELIREIRADIAAAEKLLDEPAFAVYRSNSFFNRPIHVNGRDGTHVLAAAGKRALCCEIHNCTIN